MRVDAIVQLVGSGNVEVAEQEWMKVVERADCGADDFLRLQPVLESLAEKGQTDLAGSLAWAAVEVLKEQGSTADALEVGKRFLLLLSQSEDLRTVVTSLYREVHADRPGIETLLGEAGIAGGRPPRRAIRTLDVCLNLKPGSYLASRHEDSAARVDAIAPGTWEVTVRSGVGSETLGPVECADRYAPAAQTDFRVLMRFDPERLQTLSAEDPAALVEGILKARGRQIDHEELERIVTPGIVPASDWSKWWSKARTALRRAPHVKVQGRSPYVLKYVGEAGTFEQEFEARFTKLRSAGRQLDALEGYLRDCRTRKHPPDKAMLGRLHEPVARRSKRLEAGGGKAALPEHLVEWRLGELIGVPDAERPAVDLLAGAADPGALIRTCDTPALCGLACACLESARPEDWVDIALETFPTAPQDACDDLASRMERAGVAPEKIDRVVGAVLSDAVGCYEALCWIWDRGLGRDRWQGTAPVTILSKMLWLLGEIKRDETLSAERARAVRSAARSALAARKYERFVECLEGIESGMGSALRTQIQRLDNLGRNVHEDLLNRIRRRFPELWARRETPIWAREDAIYSTEDGMARWDAEIQELVNVKMRENAKAIGAAAEKGDLSENAEYKFALEERDLLRARLAHMQDQRSKAQRILPEQVPRDRISVGAKVRFRNVENGELFEATFLGPFEASTEQRIYNYQSPIGQDVMGRRVGDLVELPLADPAGTYEVDSITSWDE